MRKRMKRMQGLSGSIVRPDPHGSSLRPARLQPERDQPARQRECGEDRCDDADRQRDGKAAHRPGPETEQDDRRDQRGQVGVDDRAKGACGSRHRATADATGPPPLLAHALIDDHVGIDRHAHVSTMPAMPGSVSVTPRTDRTPTIRHRWPPARHWRRCRACRSGNMKANTRACRDDRGELAGRIESAPRLGPTVRSSTIVSLAGSAPARSRTARSLAPWTVKLPEIWPEPPRIGSRICGAEITLLSSTMAKSLPTLCCVAGRSAARPWSKRKVTIGSLVRWSNAACASTRSSPETMTRFSIR